MSIFWIGALGVGAMGYVILLLAIARDLKYITWPITLMVGSVGMIAATLLGERVNNTWVAPIQDKRPEIYLALALTVLFGALAHARRVSIARIPVQAYFVLMIQLYAGFLRMFHEGPAAGLQTIVFAIAVQTGFILALPAILQSAEDHLRVIRALGFGLLIWIGAVLVQFVINPGEMNPRGAGRFTGLAGGAQQLAVYLGPLGAFMLYLTLNDTRTRFKVLWSLGVGFTVVFLVLSGSRAGVGMFVLGSMGVLATRLGKAILLAPVAGVFGYLAWELLDVLGLTGAERLMSAGDTRSAAWGRLFDQAISNPAIGVGFYNVSANENSYLVGVAAYGLGMGLLIFGLVVAWCIQAYRLLLVRRYLPREAKRSADLWIGYTAVYFGGAMFEWYIIARLDLHTLLAVVAGAMISSLIAEGKAYRDGLVPSEDEQPADESSTGDAKPALGY